MTLTSRSKKPDSISKESYVNVFQIPKPTKMRCQIFIPIKNRKFLSVYRKILNMNSILLKLNLRTD